MFRLDCERPGRAKLYVMIPNGAIRFPRVVGRPLQVGMQAGSGRLSITAVPDDYQGSLTMEATVAADGPLFAAMAGAQDLKVTSAAGGFDLNLRTAGRAVNAWRAACGAAPPTQEAAGPGGPGRLQRYIGTHDVAAFMREPPVASALSAFMSAAILREFRDTFEVVGPIAATDGLLVLTGGKAHANDTNAAILTVDPNGATEAGLLGQGRVTVYGKRSREELSAPMLEWLGRVGRNAGPVRFQAGVRASASDAARAPIAEQAAARAPDPTSSLSTDLLGLPAFGADIVVTRLRETTLRHIGALPPGQPVRAVANNLAMLLTLKAYPNALAPDERRLSIANVLPDRLRPYLDAPRFEGDLRWSGRTEFEREDTRKRFLANEREAYTRRVPDLPLTFVLLSPLRLRGQYNVEKQGFDIELASFSELHPTAKTPWPHGGERFLHVDQDAGRDLRKRQEDLLEMAAAERAAPLMRGQTRDTTWKNLELFTAERVEVSSVRAAPDGIVVDLKAIDIRLFDPRDVSRPIMEIPLPTDAVRAGPAAAAGPVAGAPVLYDPEVPLLLMARHRPALVADQRFAASALEIRRNIESTNRRTCAATTGDRQSCIPTTWPALLPSGMTSSLGGAIVPADIEAYRPSLRDRAATFGQTIAFEDVCARRGICKTRADGKIEVSLVPLLGGNNLDANSQQIAQETLPGFARYGWLGAENVRTDDLTWLQVYIANGANAAWDELVVDPAAKIGIEFRIGRTAADARWRERRSEPRHETFVVEVDPAAVVRIGAGGTVERRSLLPDAATQAALQRTGEVPSAPWEVLGIRLGMPVAEAEAILRERYAAEAFTEPTLLPAVTGTPQCQAVLRQMTNNIQKRLNESARAMRDSGRPPAPEQRVADTEHTREIVRTAAAELVSIGCPDPEAGPLTVGYTLKVIYPDTINPGDGAKELVVLYRTGSSLGGPAIVTAVYRAMQPPSGQRTAFEDAVKQHYAGTSVEIGGNGRAWMDSPARRSAFVPDRCGAFWPGNGSFDVPNLPSILQAECGPVLRFSQDRLLMIDTTYLRRAASAASKPEPAAAKGPRIRL